MRSMFLRILCVVFFLTFQSCGYRWVGSEEQLSLSIPYVVGDSDGSLTAELIHAFQADNRAIVTREAGYRLKVAIIQDQTEPIGFRRDPQKVKGKVRKNLLESEARKTVSLDVALYKKGAKEPSFGPVRVTSYVDYDYIDGDSLKDLQFTNAKGEQRTVLPFSLGQLEPSEAAQEAAARPLYRDLARKVVDVISSQWY